MKTPKPSAPAEPVALPDAAASAPPTDEVLATPSVDEGTADAGREPGSPDPLDHDRNGRAGGIAPAPAETHLVVQRDDPGRGLASGEVIAVADADVWPLLEDDLCRPATAQDVDLAAPRVRAWAPAP